MNLESVTGSGGTPMARPAPSPAEGPAHTRPGGWGKGEGEAAAGRSGVTAPAESVSRADLEQLVEEVNTDLGRLNEKLGFRVHEATGQLVVQIVDRNSGEVVRESPPPEFLDLAARMKEMVGLFLDEQG